MGLELTSSVPPCLSGSCLLFGGRTVNKQSNRLLLLALLAVAAGCNDPKTREIERLRADLEASRADAARARAEADAARADLVQALADAQVARPGPARLKGEPVP